MRTEARLFTRIWDDDPEWTARSLAAQWAYMMLVSQRDLEHHGGIALRIPRWTHLASDLTETVLTAAVDELTEHRFVIVDRDYGELFVRSLVREDRVYKQPNVLRSAADRLSEVRSPAILAAMHAELQRVNDLPDLTENCRLIVMEMLEATLPGAPRPVRRPRRRPSKAARHATGNPSATTTGDASAEGAPNPSGNGAPNPSDNAKSRPSGKGSAYRSDKPAGKGSGSRSSAAKTTPPATTAQPPAATSPNPTPKATAKATPNPSGTPSSNAARKAPSQTRPHPSTIPTSDENNQPRSDYRRVLADWLRSTGDQTPTAELVADVERVLANALRAGVPAAHAADVLRRWHTEHGTDPDRLATMIANAADPGDASATPAAAPASTGGPMSQRDLEALTAATVAITNPWLATLATPLSDDELDDIEYHVSRGLLEGARPAHVAASLAAWHASGSTDVWQLTDLIDADPDRPHPDGEGPAVPPPPTHTAAAAPAADDDDGPRTAEEWLATARANP